MYWFWVVLMASNPAFLVMGALGVFGDEAEKVANDMSEGVAVFLVIVVGVGILYFALTSLWGFIAR